MRVKRPWGWYEELASGSGYKVKVLLVRAGCQLSLQRHRHRSESWTVVAGDGRLFCDDKWYKASPGLMLSIPYGSVHRATGGKKDLIISEVQHGDYLEEEDLEDPVFDVPLDFNPCHPEYGSWVALDENGNFSYLDYLNHMTTDRIRLWANDSFSDAGLDQTYDDIDPITQGNMFTALIAYLANNASTFGECPNINYSDDADDEPADA